LSRIAKSAIRAGKASAGATNPRPDRAVPAADDTSRRQHPDPTHAAADKPGRTAQPWPAGAAPEDLQHWFDLETILELPVPIASFADAAAHYRRAARSENTRRAYRAAVARFCA